MPTTSPPLPPISTRREIGGSFRSRSQKHISISDPAHHVTEAIGDMYGDDEDWKRQSQVSQYSQNSQDGMGLGSPTSPGSTRRSQTLGALPSANIQSSIRSVGDNDGGRSPGGGNLRSQPLQSSSNARPLSFLPSPNNMSPESDESYFSNMKWPGMRTSTSGDPTTAPDERTGTISDNLHSPKTRPSAQTNGGVKGKSHTVPALLPSQARKGVVIDAGTPPSPSPSLRENQHLLSSGGGQAFPLSELDDLNNDPLAFTKELNNLQALRRMSMDVGNTSDPDLPTFGGIGGIGIGGGISVMPSVAPTGGDDEEDPNRLFWVPARVHPELAPMEFKSFLENRVKTIKRRSGESLSLSPDSLERSGSGSSLRRKKSMLSRQIDNKDGKGALGYQDGAEKLERRKSTLNQSIGPELKLADLTELDEMVRDPSKAMEKLSLSRGVDAAGQEVPSSEDMPILPAAPGGGLKRSTHTTYRKGSLRRGERAPYSKRAAERAGLRGLEGTDSEDSAAGTPPTETYPRPGRRRGPTVEKAPPMPDSIPEQFKLDRTNTTPAISEEREQLDTTKAQPPNRSGSLQLRQFNPRNESPIPQIVETPPEEEESTDGGITGGPKVSPQYPFPERSSSYTAPTEPPPRSSRRPQVQRLQSSVGDAIPKIATPTTEPAKPASIMGQEISKESAKSAWEREPSREQSRETRELAQTITSPEAVNNATSYDLTYIPTMPAPAPDRPSRESSVKLTKLRDDDTESVSSKKSWFSFKSDGSRKGKKKDKEKEREKEKEKYAEKLGAEDDEPRKGKLKTSMEKVHDTARLDVLQAAVEQTAQRGRESLLLDRDSIDNKLTEDRRKESNRKSTEKEKEKEGKDGKGGLFGLFSSRSKKNASDLSPAGGKHSKKKSSSSLRPNSRHSADSARGPGRPDVDYQWTRFSLLEERAIYRMAHIKLANPRRELRSQVLLSNFMYGYLEKVREMHPGVNIPGRGDKTKERKEREEREAAERARREEEERQYQEQQRLIEEERLAAESGGGYGYGFDVRPPFPFLSFQASLTSKRAPMIPHSSTPALVRKPEAVSRMLTIAKFMIMINGTAIMHTITIAQRIIISISRTRIRMTTSMGSSTMVAAMSRIGMDAGIGMGTMRCGEEWEWNGESRKRIWVHNTFVWRMVLWIAGQRWPGCIARIK